MEKRRNEIPRDKNNFPFKQFNIRHEGKKIYRRGFTIRQGRGGSVAKLSLESMRFRDFFHFEIPPEISILLSPERKKLRQRGNAGGVLSARRDAIRESFEKVAIIKKSRSFLRTAIMRTKFGRVVSRGRKEIQEVERGPTGMGEGERKEGGGGGEEETAGKRFPGLRTLWTEDFFKGRRNFIAYRTVRILFRDSLSCPRNNKNKQIIPILFWPNRSIGRATNLTYSYAIFTSARESKFQEKLSGFGRRNSRKPRVTIGRVFDSRRNSTVERRIWNGEFQGSGDDECFWKRDLYFLEPVGQHRLHYYGCAAVMDRRRVFEKIQRKIKRQRERGEYERGEKIRDERKISGERRERREEEKERERERKREAWAEENGGTRRERKRDSRGREFGVMKEKEGEKKGAAN